MIACGTVEIFFESMSSIIYDYCFHIYPFPVWIAFLLITREKLSTGTIRSEKYRDTVHLYMRTIAFTMLQFGPVV
jgi:hypothetical protein